MTRKRIVLFSIVVLVGAAFILDATGSLDQYLALVFPPSAISSTYLKNKYSESKPVRILIVPGHEVLVPGALYGGFAERELNTELAEKLLKLFEKDAHYEVVVTQNRAGYTQEFADYFEKNRNTIQAFRDNLRSAMKSLFKSGAVNRKIAVVHNTAKPEIGTRLYGINKWARDNAIDIVLHLHFNDYPGHVNNGPGEYTGFAVYIPEHQLPNFEASNAIARSLKTEFLRYFPVSSHPQESAGVVEDQDLIAVGASASLESAGVLVEYGYIYEPQFAERATRSLALSELAQQTYNGFKRFFEGVNAPVKEAAVLPHTWNDSIAFGAKHKPDIFALQIALSRDGLYPPAGKTRTECPPSGNFGPCTRDAIRAFQARQGILTTGALDIVTLAKLDELYGK